MIRDWSIVLAEHQRVVADFAAMGPTLERVVAAIVGALRAGRRVYTFGNGGSAADAQHVAAELLGRFRLERRAWPATALSSDPSTLTAIANDLGYEEVFARPLSGLVEPGDVGWAFSTSGQSPNVLRGLAVARQRGAVTVGFTGAGGGMAELCDHLVRVNHPASDRVQELHQLAYHFVCEQVESQLAQNDAR